MAINIYRNKIKILTPIFFLINICIAYPTIIIHGIASDKTQVEPFSAALNEELNENNNYKVYNMEIGNGKLTSIFMDINEQCEIFSNNINNLNISQEKINLIGFSQGGLIARCYVEKYSHKVINVNTLITIATPHMGVYSELNIKPPATNYYWKDPYKYYKTNDFILFLNNELFHEDYNIYKNNIKGLTNFVIIWSQIENVITPLESSKFEFYDISKAVNSGFLEIQSFKDSPIYINDSLGLVKLYDSNRLLFYNIDCNHEEFKLPSCFDSNGLLKTIVHYLI